MTYARACRRCNGGITETKSMRLGADGLPVYTCRVACECAAGEYESDDKRAATNQARRRYWGRMKSREIA